MKTKILVVVIILVVLGLMATSIVISENRTGIANPQVVSLKEQLRKANVTQTQHDSVNNATISDDAKLITELTNQKITLCKQVLGAKLVQPLCLK